ncbi:calcium-binding protein [Pseudooceanicola onchidii]|uniref:calcium-binding protein n=1 Tax=Pseudooceanicola onchidii TaxID=2562279 RepID=UPI0010A9A9DC|nr:hypothetical protein [Pseudooceanicola onchidii]
MTQLILRATLTGNNISLYGGVADLTPLSDEALARTWIFAGAQSTGTMTRYQLDDLGTIQHRQSETISASTTYRISDAEVVGDDAPHLLVSAVETASIAAFAIGPDGSLGEQTTISAPLMGPVTQMEVIEAGGYSFVATGSRDSAGLRIYEWVDGETLAPRATVTDHGKTALGNVTDMAGLRVGGTEYLAVASTTDEAVSTYWIGTDGTPELIDSLGIKDGMWIAGLDGLATVAAHGESFVAVGATMSSSLTLLRVNDHGVMFQEDHLIDTLDTRFSRVDALTGFEVGERGFLVVGGADDGLTLLEIMPDRSCHVRSTLVNSQGGAMENIVSLSAVSLTSEIQIVAAGQPGLTLATLDKTSIAAPLIGTGAADDLVGGGRDDLIWGNAGDDILTGGAGADIIAGGAGQDVLTGGDGADVFVFSADTGMDRVTDFQLGVDRIDVSAWGRIYDVQSLTIDDRWDGADLSFGDFSLRLSTLDPTRLTEIELTNDCFIF